MNQFFSVRGSIKLIHKGSCSFDIKHTVFKAFYSCTFSQNCFALCCALSQKFPLLFQSLEIISFITSLPKADTLATRVAISININQSVSTETLIEVEVFGLLLNVSSDF